MEKCVYDLKRNVGDLSPLVIEYASFLKGMLTLRSHMNRALSSSPSASAASGLPSPSRFVADHGVAEQVESSASSLYATTKSLLRTMSESVVRLNSPTPTRRGSPAFQNVDLLDASAEGAARGLLTPIRLDTLAAQTLVLHDASGEAQSVVQTPLAPLDLSPSPGRPNVSHPRY
ncbi:MAG: hypothetical protein EOO65_03725 [Methanosarcinales archaeon]|nr:MAG: hypothetical protein EOO65_03725 [Methanosarcinales archaeon]